MASGRLTRGDLVALSLTSHHPGAHHPFSYHSRMFQNCFVLQRCVLVLAHVPCMSCLTCFSIVSSLHCLSFLHRMYCLSCLSSLHCLSYLLCLYCLYYPTCLSCLHRLSYLFSLVFLHCLSCLYYLTSPEASLDSSHWFASKDHGRPSLISDSASLYVSRVLSSVNEWMRADKTSSMPCRP